MKMKNKKYNIRNILKAIVVLGFLIIILYLNSLSITGNAVWNKNNPISIKRIIPECSLLEECRVKLEINISNNINNKLEIKEKIPSSWKVVYLSLNYSSYNKKRNQLIWILDKDNIIDNITYTLIPVSKSGEFSGSWLYNKRDGRITGETKIRIKKEIKPLTINITYPANNANVTIESFYFTAITNRNAVCKYQKNNNNNAEDKPQFELMNITRGVSHFQFIDNLQDKNDYILKLYCIDELKSSQTSYVKFSVRNPMPAEYAKLSTATGGLWVGYTINSNKRVLTSSDLPNLLANGKVYYDNLSFHKIYYSDDEILEINYRKNNCETINWCEGADINKDGTVNMTDRSLLRKEVGRDDCKIENDWCNRADINHDGKVLDYNYEEGILFQYSPIFLVGSAKIENSTSNDDLNYPEILIEVGTNPDNYFYRYRLLFSKGVDFSDGNVRGKILRFLGKNYTINGNSTNSKIILSKKESNYNIVLENNQTIKINNEIVNGTFVYIDNRSGNVTKIEISFAMQNPEKDYILVGEYYDNPVFDNLRLFFKSYSVEKGAEIYLGGLE